jgi:hypothetical protein
MFSENNLSIQIHIRCMPPKNIATNHNVQEDHVIHGEIKEIYIHASGRFIVNNDKGNFVALRLIIKKKTFIHAFNIYAFICNIVNESPIRLFSTSN